MKKQNKYNHVAIPIVIISIIIIFLQNTFSYDLSIVGIVLFTILYGYIIFKNRERKYAIILLIATYLFFIGTYLAR